MELVRSLCSCVDGRPAFEPQQTDHLDYTLLGFRAPGRSPRQRRARGGLGVGRIGLAVLSPRLAARPVHLDDRHPHLAEMPGESRPVRTSSLDADAIECAEAAKPRKQLRVPHRGGRERGVAEHPSRGIESCRGVSVLVRIYSAGDARSVPCRVHNRPLPRGKREGPDPNRATDRTVTGAGARAPMRSRSPDWIQPRATEATADCSTQRHSREVGPKQGSGCRPVARAHILTVPAHARPAHRLLHAVRVAECAELG